MNDKTNELTHVKGYIDPRFTFDNFVVEPNNELCVSACRAVVEQPGEAHNPLYIYSEVGLGTTHLMQAIGNALVAKRQTSIVCKTTERFVTSLITAIREGTTQAFRYQYQNTDVLMIAYTDEAGHPNQSKPATL